MKRKAEVISRISDAIQAAGPIAVVSHDRPDGDAIGCSLAMGRLLEQAGKAVVLINNDPVPGQLRFLPGVEKVTHPGQRLDEVFDLIVALDAAGKDRISESVWSAIECGEPTVINIDHHSSNTEFGDINLVDAESPATAQIVYELAVEFGWKIDSDAADQLYCGISTDTGSFQYPNTSAKTYRIGADLIDAGADVGRLNQLLYETYPQRRIQLLRFLLQDVRIDFEARCASMSLPLKASRDLQLQPGDTEGMIDIIRSIDTVIVAVFFEELPDGKIRISSRSKSKAVGVGEICESLGGGGHILAAGVRLAGPLEVAREKFLAAVGAKIASAET